MFGFEKYDKTYAPTPLPKTASINGLNCNNPIKLASRANSNSYVLALDLFRKQQASEGKTK